MVWQLEITAYDQCRWSNLGNFDCLDSVAARIEKIEGYRISSFSFIDAEHRSPDDAPLWPLQHNGEIARYRIKVLVNR